MVDCVSANAVLKKMGKEMQSLDALMDELTATRPSIEELEVARQKAVKVAEERLRANIETVFAKHGIKATWVSHEGHGTWKLDGAWQHPWVVFDGGQFVIKLMPDYMGLIPARRFQDRLEVCIRILRDLYNVGAPTKLDERS